MNADSDYSSSSPDHGSGEDSALSAGQRFFLALPMDTQDPGYVRGNLQVLAHCLTDYRRKVGLCNSGDVGLIILDDAIRVFCNTIMEATKSGDIDAEAIMHMPFELDFTLPPATPRVMERRLMLLQTAIGDLADLEDMQGLRENQPRSKPYLTTASIDFRRAVRMQLLPQINDALAHQEGHANAVVPLNSQHVHQTGNSIVQVDISNALSRIAAGPGAMPGKPR